MADSAETPARPELRLSPDGTRIAQQWNAEVVWSWSWVTVKGKLLSGVARAGDVADWLPLVPAPATVDRDAVVEAVCHALDPDECYLRTGDQATAVVDALLAAGYLTVPAPVSEDQVQHVTDALLRLIRTTQLVRPQKWGRDRAYCEQVARAAITAMQPVRPPADDQRAVAVVTAVVDALDPNSSWPVSAIIELHQAVAAELANDAPHQLRRVVVAVCRVLGIPTRGAMPGLNFQQLGSIVNQAMQGVPRG